jgi:hypothetical protein
MSYKKFHRRESMSKMENNTATATRYISKTTQHIHR